MSDLREGDFDNLPDTQDAQRLAIIKWRTELEEIAARGVTLPADLQQAGRGEIAPGPSGGQLTGVIQLPGSPERPLKGIDHAAEAVNVSGNRWGRRDTVIRAALTDSWRFGGGSTEEYGRLGRSGSEWRDRSVQGHLPHGRGALNAHGPDRSAGRASFTLIAMRVVGSAALPAVPVLRMAEMKPAADRPRL